MGVKFAPVSCRFSAIRIANIPVSACKKTHDLHLLDDKQELCYAGLCCNVCSLQAAVSVKKRLQQVLTNGLKGDCFYFKKETFSTEFYIFYIYILFFTHNRTHKMGLGQP